VLNELVVENLQADLVTSLDLVGLGARGSSALVASEVVAIIMDLVSTHMILMLSCDITYELTISMKEGM
jgi:hypothetical protein